MNNHISRRNFLKRSAVATAIPAIMPANRNTDCRLDAEVRELMLFWDRYWYITQTCAQERLLRELVIGRAESQPRAWEYTTLPDDYPLMTTVDPDEWEFHRIREPEIPILMGEFQKWCDRARQPRVRGPVVDTTKSDYVLRELERRIGLVPPGVAPLRSAPLVGPTGDMLWSCTVSSPMFMAPEDPSPRWLAWAMISAIDGLWEHFRRRSRTRMRKVSDPETIFHWRSEGWNYLIVQHKVAGYIVPRSYRV